MKFRKLFILLVLTIGLFNVNALDTVSAKSMVACGDSCTHNFGCCMRDCGYLNCAWWQVYNCEVASEQCQKRCDADGVPTQAPANCPVN